MCVCFLWPRAQLSYFLFFSPSNPLTCFDSVLFPLPPLFSWQLWAPTISSHTAHHHLLHFTDCGCSRAKFTALPHKPTLLLRVSGALRSAAPIIFFVFCFFFAFIVGVQNCHWMCDEMMLTFKQSGAVSGESLTMLRVLSFSATFVVEYLSQGLLFMHRHAYARTRAHSEQGTFDRRLGAQERAVWELFLHCTTVVHFVLTCHLLDLCCCFVSFLLFYSQIYWKADTGWRGACCPHICAELWHFPK